MPRYIYIWQLIKHYYCYYYYYERRSNARKNSQQRSFAVCHKLSASLLRSSVHSVPYAIRYCRSQLLFLDSSTPTASGAWQFLIQVISHQGGHINRTKEIRHLSVYTRSTTLFVEVEVKNENQNGM